jgi:hypothetical protein
MRPNPIPQEPGCLSVLLHPGTFPTQICFEAFTFVAGKIIPKGIPVIGSIGTNDPAIWRHVIWWGGRAFEAKLKSDLSGYHASFESLRDHYLQHPDVWTEVAP